MLVLPLALDNLQAKVSAAIGEIISNGVAYSEALAQVGKGIAALFLLIVAVYYITSILDGGKFQTKMLIPLFIFIFVCNFSWIASPVTGFISELSGSIQTACQNAKNSQLAAMGSQPGNNPDDVVRQELLKNGKNKEAVDRLTGSEDDEEGGGGITGMGTKMVKRGVKSAANSSMGAMIDQLSNEQAENQTDVDNEAERNSRRSPGEYTSKSIFSVIISFIADILRMVLSLFGAVMTAIIIAFGPITWAFAVIPGQAGTIKSWFIRLCQYSLWAPIVSLIDALTFSFFSGVAQGEIAIGFLLSIVVAVLNIVAFTSVPSIASMIIEGASGAVSLSQGLQAVGAPAAAVAGMAMKGTKGLAGGIFNYAAAKQGAGGALNSLKTGWQQGGGIGGFLGRAAQMDASGHKAGFGGALKKTIIDGHRTNKQAYKEAGRDFKG